MRFIKLNECSDVAVQRGVSAGIPEGRGRDRLFLRGDILWDAGEISLKVPEDLVFMPRETAIELLRHATTRGEAHLLDFSRMIYGRRLEVSFLKHLRPERKFADFAALRNQIAADRVAAQAFFEAGA